jgi:hypothetical protein
MAHVTTTSDILAHLSPSSKSNVLHKPAPVLPSARREHARLWTFFHSLITPILRWRSRRQQPDALRMPQQFETPIDLLARKHPFIYIKALSG